MAKKIGVVIGASRDAIHSIQIAQKNGIYVIGMDGNPEAEGLTYADEARVVDISDVDRVSVAIQEINPDFIIPIPIGRYLSTMGAINERFGLIGPLEQATTYSIDKYLFHEELHKTRLRNIDAFLINHDTEYDQIKSISFPALFKPRYGSGSRDIFFVNSQKELKDSFSSVVQKNEDFILEQVVEGTEYGVDGAVINGRLHLILLREKVITPIPVRQAVAYFSVVADNENEVLIDRVYGCIAKTVKVLGYDDCLLHADIVVNENEVFVIEIAPRPSGHDLHNVFVPLATGIDMADEYIHFLLHREYLFQPEFTRKLQIRFFDFENVIITKVPSIEELREKPNCNLLFWECNIHNGDFMNKVSDGHSIMHRGFFIMEGSSREDLIAQSEWVLSQFEYREKE